MRKFDLIVFGATGFTGRYVVERLAQTIHKNGLPTRWAIAVRNPAKMKQYLRQMEPSTGIANLAEKTPVLEADVNDLVSMRKVFQQGKLALSCIGPYSLLGEPVVKACIDASTNYMDLSGEPLFMEKIAVKYNLEAQKKNIFVVSSCGFDSIPSDVGTQYLKQRFQGHLSQVDHCLEVWFNPKNKYSFASWVSLIEGFKHADELKQIRRQLFSQFGPLYKPYDYRVAQKRRRFARDQRGYIVPFPGSDRSVTKRTQLYRYAVLNEPPVQFEAYYCMPNWRQLLFSGLMNYNLSLLSKSTLGEKLLRQYASFFSLGLFSQGTMPNHDTLRDDLFRITLVGKGWPRPIADADKRADNMSKQSALVIRGSNLAYIDTSTIAVHTALTLLEQLQRPTVPIPFGVVTPASILEPDLLIPRLNGDGVLFDFIEDYP